MDQRKRRSSPSFTLELKREIPQRCRTGKRFLGKLTRDDGYGFCDTIPNSSSRITRRQIVASDPGANCSLVLDKHPHRSYLHR